MIMTQQDLFQLTGKVALVTGAGSGIGRAISESLAEYGSDVVCADIIEARAEETAGIIRKYGIRAVAIHADISKESEVKALFAKVDRDFGKLDVLFNNAGVTTRGKLLHEMPLDDWNKVINVDLTGVFLCMKEGICLMLRQKKGSIVNIASVLALGGVDPAILSTSNYTAAKHGVIGLTKSAAVQYGQHNIRVNAIAPGFFQGTRLNESQEVTKEEAQSKVEMIKNLTPMQRTGDTDELKGLAVYLASDASSFITGATMVADGGWCAW
jgi:NAD(P)-dependent dehydrogenase (short-subunit alcohol dehydrogenase family)